MKLTLFAIGILSLSCICLKNRKGRNKEVSTFTQDTIAYCQAKSLWISNCLYFFKSEKNSDSGTFKKIMESDDGQYWYGTGKYVETKNRVTLYSFILIRSLNNSIKDSTTIPTSKYLKTSDSLIQLEYVRHSKTIFIRQ